MLQTAVILQVSIRFKKTAISLTQVFCVIQYIGFQTLQSKESVLKVLVESLETVVDQIHFLVNLHSFLLHSVSPGTPFFPGNSFAPFRGTTTSETPPSLKNSKIALVRAFPQFCTIATQIKVI